MFSSESYDHKISHSCLCFLFQPLITITEDKRPREEKGKDFPQFID